MLEKNVREHLTRGYEQLLEQGQLPSREKLPEYYATFRRHFAPEKLLCPSSELLGQGAG